MNSEARRHNALIRANSLDEPLQPLLRPPPVPRSEWPLSVSIPDAAAEGGGSTASAYTDKAPQAVPLTNRVFSDSDAVPSKPSGRGRHGLPRLEIEPPTPSPLFPRDLTSLMRLGQEEARALVKEYGLVRVRYAKKVAQSPLSAVAGEAGPQDGTSTGKDKDKQKGKEKEQDQGQDGKKDEDASPQLEPIIEEETREESLNRFMSYIGVRT